MIILIYKIHKPFISNSYRLVRKLSYIWAYNEIYYKSLINNYQYSSFSIKDKFSVNDIIILIIFNIIQAIRDTFIIKESIKNACIAIRKILLSRECKSS